MIRTRTRVVLWLFALALVAAFTSLGLWQSRRAVEKERMLEHAARVLDGRRPVTLARATERGDVRSVDWAEGRGRFAARRPLLLDNQLRNGRAGVQVYRLFRPDSGGELLVDLGWVPLPGDRRLPALPAPPSTPVEVRGLLIAPPSAGIALGPPLADAGPAWLMSRFDLRAIDAAAGDPGRTLAPRVLRLDPALPFGHERDLVLLANTLPPDKHRGYALQWFGLAATVLLTALILTFRRSRR